MHERAVLGLKWSPSKGKFGKLHASKEKLWSQMLSFLVPKRSPLQVSVFYLHE